MSLTVICDETARSTH